MDRDNIESPPQEDITIIDNLEWLSKHFKFIIRVTAVPTIIAFLIAFFSASEYTSRAKAIKEPLPESSSTMVGGLSALRGLGISLGGESNGLSTGHYPDIIRSREVRLEVVRSQYYFPDIDSSLSLAEYWALNPPIAKRIINVVRKYTIDLVKNLRKRIIDAPARNNGGYDDASMSFPTLAEEVAIIAVGELISVSVDRTTDILHLKVVTHDPFLSYKILVNCIDALIARVNAINTKKASESLEFIRTKLNEAELKLIQRENEAALFVDQNRGISTAILTLELDRLKRKVNFQSDLFSNLQAQLTQSEIELQRSSTVLSLLESPRPAMEASGPKRKIVVVLGLVIGIIMGILLALVRDIILPEDKKERDRILNAFAGFGSERFRSDDRSPQSDI